MLGMKTALPTLLLMLILLPALAACAAASPEQFPAAAPTPTRNSSTTAILTDLPPSLTPFWDCLLRERRRWHSGRPLYQLFNPEPSTALQAARRCADDELPPWRPEEHPPEDGAAVRNCLDQERERFLTIYPEREALAAGDNFFLQGLKQVCYLPERARDFRFHSPENPPTE